MGEAFRVGEKVGFSDYSMSKAFTDEWCENATKTVMSGSAIITDVVTHIGEEVVYHLSGSNFTWKAFELKKMAPQVDLPEDLFTI